MINVGDIKDLRGNVPLPCARLSSLLPDVATTELVFALERPATPSMERLQAQLLLSARYAQRRHRGLHAALPATLFRDASWIILLNCFTALLEGKILCVKQIQSNLEESHTAVLRLIDALESHGLVGRERDPVDGRRTQVLLTRNGAAALADYLQAFGDPAGACPSDPAEARQVCQ